MIDDELQAIRSSCFWLVVYALTEVQCSECATGDAGNVGAGDCEGEEGEG